MSGNEFVPLDDPDWIDKMMELAQSGEQIEDDPEPKQGAMCIANDNGRRGSIAWVSKGIVCVSFDDMNILARKEYTLHDFNRLYQMV